MIKSAGGVQILDAPFSSDTSDHPPEEGPKIGIDIGIVQRLQRVGQGVDLEPVRKRLSAATNKDERVDHSRGSPHIAGSREAVGIERKLLDEELPEFRVVPDAIFGEDECLSLSIEDGIFDDSDLAS